MENFYHSRAVYVPPTRKHEGVTAYLVKDEQIKGKKLLLTYPTDKDWMLKTFPDIEIEDMKPNHVEEIEQDMKLNDNVIPTALQKAAIKAIVDNDFHEAFFNIPTGAGKTLLSTYLISILKKKAWVMCFRTIVLGQWIKTMENMTSCDTSRVLLVKSSKTLLKMAMGDWDPSKYDVYLSTPILLTSFAKRYGWDLLNDAMDTCGIGVKFFDEAHYNLGNIVKINALTNIERTYYLSADFDQSDTHKAKLFYQMFQNVPIIKPNEEVSNSMKYTVGIVVHFNTKPSLQEIDHCFGRYGFSAYRYMQYEIDQEKFMMAISYVLADIRRADPGMKYKILMLWNLIEHVDFFYDIIKEKIKDIYGEDAPEVVRYHSQLSEEERKHALEKGQLIVSTYQSMSVGVDLKMIRYVMSLSPVSHIEDNQAAGRARALPGGEDCFYFLFQDDGFPNLRRRLPYRLQYLESQKIKKLYSININ